MVDNKSIFAGGSMDDLLLTLFEAFDAQEASPEEKAAIRAADPIYNRAREKLTRDELDELWSAALRVGSADVETSFVRGFRLGARLMLEVLERDV